MSLSKALCVLCECPTADGAVLAVHVDKDKLQHWALNVCGHELAHEIDDEDQICYFCVWQAEFDWKFNGMADEALVWWNLDFDNAAKELRKYFFDGSVEQCWVQLEEIEFPTNYEEKNTVNFGPINQSGRMNCFYCQKEMQNKFKLWKHMREEHKNAIRCENRSCVTYFHTLEERDSHQKEVHEKPKERKVIKCNFCVKQFEGLRNYKKHVRLIHREFPVKCSQQGSCLSYFKTKIEMEAHFGSVHALQDEAKRFQCGHCGFKARLKAGLERHISMRHLAKCIKCELCDKVVSTNALLKTHVRNYHTFKECSLCGKKVTLYSMQHYHLKVTNCNRCKNKFQCSGLFQSHLQACKQTLFKCDKCPIEYKNKSILDRHVKRHQLAYLPQNK